MKESKIFIGLVIVLGTLLTLAILYAKTVPEDTIKAKVYPTLEQNREAERILENERYQTEKRMNQATVGFTLLLIATFIIGFYGVPIHLVAKSAENKGHDYIAYLLLGFFISPLITFIIVRLLPEKAKRMNCPECAESILLEAKSCLYCDCIINRQDRIKARKNKF